MGNGHHFKYCIGLEGCRWDPPCQIIRMGLIVIGAAQPTVQTGHLHTCDAKVERISAIQNMQPHAVNELMLVGVNELQTFRMRGCYNNLMSLRAGHDS